MDDHDIESRKLAIAERQLEADIQHRNAELEIRRSESTRQSVKAAPQRVWDSPSGLAVVGAILTLLTAISTNFIQSQKDASQRAAEHKLQIDLERQKFQSQLIEKAIERAANPEGAAINLQFLWQAGLVPDYEKIREIVKESGKLPESGPTLPSGETFRSTFPSIIGADERILIGDTKVFPYSAVCYLSIESKNGTRFRSTGFLVSPRVVITAAYVVHSDADDNDRLTATVNPGRNGDESPFGEWTSSDFRISSDRSAGGDQNQGIGAVILPSAVDGAGYLKLQSLSEQELSSSKVNLIGYPGDKPNKTLWRSSGVITNITPDRFGHDADTSAGMGGSPVIVEKDGTSKVVGMHVSSGSSVRAIRFTDDVINTIQGWIDEAEGAE